ncbi:hypothetical protein C8024_12095 [Sphingopyxis sp. BSNA05]|uniref:Eco29kI family restriction endonuclease n=1 Tax=Sphingopyxis sp. BSNA05 TaxID=1236614 RepID=UPI001567A666|nr:hypothetical protein [Sphingopyxis sp. BSNA05]
MPPSQPFAGAGVYALYYSGSHPAYQGLTRLSGAGKSFPVYVGKAAGQSAKQGFNPATSSARKLYDRINQHADSIDAVSCLDKSDFSCRYLVLNDAYIALAESVLISVFRPPWNGMSFGSKVVGKNRMGGRPSLWDSLHPGRAGRPAGSKSRAGDARRLIDQRVSELGAGISDPVLRKMYDRIMRFA